MKYRMLNIGIYIYEHAEVLDFSGPFEVFTTATRINQSDPPPFNTFLISEHGGNVVARAGYTVVSDDSIDNHPDLDVLIVVGGDHNAEMHKENVLQWVSEQAKQTSITASVCTGAFILAQAEVLTTQSVTTHWADSDDLQQCFPELKVIKHRRWVETENVITSGGISAGIDMSLYLVEKLHSLKLAEQTAKLMEFTWTRNP
ncbi:MAG: DJ-1/PfpI family protein [Arenicellales bacterium]